ncbi:MAG TPA: membrane protein insertase YidC [Smithella sp.]|nr:membrane protein insertase YidC [Smithella sp.]
MDKRTILAVVLSLAVLFIYQIFFAKPPVPPQAQSPKRETQQPVASANQTAVAQPARAAVTKPSSTLPQKKVFTQKEERPPKDIIVETDNYTAIFSTRGAALKSFRLKKYDEECAKCVQDIWPAIKRLATGGKQPDKVKSNTPVELVAVKDDSPYPLALTFPDSLTDVAADSIYEADKTQLNLTTEKQAQRLTFTRVFESGIKIEKIFTFNPDNYSIGLDVRVQNLTSAPVTQIPSLNWYEYIDPQKEPERYSSIGPVAYVSNVIKRKKAQEISAESSIGPEVSWGGYERKYFMAVAIPQDPSLTTLSMSKDAENVLAVSIKEAKSEIAPGQVASLNYNLFIGPKDYTLLKKMGLSLQEAIEFESRIPGLKWLSIGLLLFIKFLYQYVGNYGVAIILLTILIKVIFWPLGNLSYKSMKEMQKIQPKINELREKYKNDQAKLGQETMALYKEHKINPFGGCLPILIQIPVFIGLYNTLLYAIELRHSPFFGWIQDLSAKDPYYITPIIMGASQFIQQKMTPTTGDPNMAKMMLLMPIIFTFIFLNFPSGLVLYWLANNILSIGQQIYINKKFN